MNIFVGILLIALGVGALWTQMFTTMTTVYFLGWTLLVAAVAQFFYGITSGNVRQSLFSVVIGIIGVCIGLLAITNPSLSAVAFTAFIGILLLVSGIYRVIRTFIVRGNNWGWFLAGGLTSLLLGTFLLATWPFSSFFALGLFVGIELIINGALLTMQPAILFDEEREYPTSPYLAGVKGGKSKKKTQHKPTHIDKDYADRNYTKSRSHKID